jgi:hypothetical protein
MPINQLFKSMPPKNLIEELLSLYGLSGFDDDKPFSKIELGQLKTLDNMAEFIDKIAPYYLPCKKKIYLTNLNHKKLITILRQCIKLYDYKLISKEKYLKGEKFIEYQLCLINMDCVSKKNNIGIVVFD